MFHEEAFTFSYANNPDISLVGILHHPEKKTTDKAVLIIVGGPQYRIGSHRQFLLLARTLAKKGITTMRFDYRGMGDADGEIIDFEQVSIDIQSAVNELKQRTGCQEVVLWGLCDAASAALFYAYTESCISQMVLLNPWVRTMEGQAKALVKHYYLARLTSRDFWFKLLKGGVNIKSALQSLKANLAKMKTKTSPQKSAKPTQSIDANLSLPERMQQGLSAFKKPILFILSGDDLVADEFRDLIKSDLNWQQTMQSEQFQIQTLAEANHTFAKQIWRNEVEKLTIQFIHSS